MIIVVFFPADFYAGVFRRQIISVFPYTCCGLGKNINMVHPSFIIRFTVRLIRVMFKKLGFFLKNLFPLSKLANCCLHLFFSKNMKDLYLDQTVWSCKLLKSLRNTNVFEISIDATISPHVFHRFSYKVAHTVITVRS